MHVLPHSVLRSTFYVLRSCALRASTTNRTLTLIVLAGLLLRLWLWWRVPIHAPANDEHEYLQVARDLVAGRGWVFYERYHWLRAPLYPLFLAGSLLLARGDLRWAALPNIAVSTATVYLFYLLGSAVVRGKQPPTPEVAARARCAGLVAAGLSAALLPLATFASLWMSETLFTALFVGALVALLRWATCPALKTAVLAGILLGLATLTRSLPLAVLPLLGVWMLWQWPRRGAMRPYIGGAALCLLLTLGTITPWTVRNWLAYGGFIPVETGLAYNLWAFNEPREDENTIFRTLESIPNPAERAQYATEKGMQRLREDPAILLRKLWPNWFYLWRFKPIEDRFRQATYYADIPLANFTLALVLDDGLYLLILASAVAALVLAPSNSPKMLLVGWLVYAVAVALLTHAEARYRQFLYPTLVPFAAGLWAGAWWAMAHWRWKAIGLGLGLIALLLPVRSYPYNWAVTNVWRGWVEIAGDRAMARRDYLAAQAAYQRAADIDKASADALLKLGLAYDRNGQLEQAIQAYSRAAAVAPPYVAASTRLGDALRRAGALEAARQAFAGWYSDRRAISDWGWSNLRSPAPTTVDVGDGLDVGFVGGMYAPEEYGGQQARWTTGNAAIRLAGSGYGAHLQLGLAAPRPDGRPVKAEICVAARCQAVEVGAIWRTYALFVSPTCGSGGACASVTEVALRSPTFVPANARASQPGASTGSRDERQLGLLVDYARVEPLPELMVSGSAPSGQVER